MSAWSGKNCRHGHSQRSRNTQAREFLKRYEDLKTAYQKDPYPCEGCPFSRGSVYLEICDSCLQDQQDDIQFALHGDEISRA